MFPAARASVGKFKSARRLLELLEVVSRDEGLGARVLARRLGVSLSTCYHLINVLLEEGYLEKLPRQQGYRLGPAVSLLHERRAATTLERRLGPTLELLAHRSGRHAYLGRLESSEVSVTLMKSPAKRPPVGVVQGFHGASHALALGKVLLAATGAEGVERYIEDFGLEAFTVRTITDPVRLREELERISDQRFATDVAEFSENLCCLAVPLLDSTGRTLGAIGVATSAQRFGEDKQRMTHLVREAAREAEALINRKTADLSLLFKEPAETGIDGGTERGSAQNSGAEGEERRTE